MYAHPQHGMDQDEVRALRRLAGRWLRDRRELAGLSQRELAERVGFERYAFISQIEAGRGRLPPDRYEGYAEALAIDVQEMARTMLRYYDPVTYRLLFEYPQDERPPRAAPADAADSPVRSQLEAMEARLERIEERLRARTGKNEPD